MKTTVLTIDTLPLIQPAETRQLIARPQLRLRPYRLRIDPMLAPFFVIHDIKIGTHSAFPMSQDTPASQFMHGAGENFDLGRVELGSDLIMIVTNISALVPGLRADQAASRRGVPLPFIATWACIVLPPRRLARRARDFVPPLFGEPVEGVEADGREDLDSRIGDVQETTGRPKEPVRREHPGFGWDPYGGE